MSHFEHGHELIGAEEVHRAIADAEGGCIGKAFHVVDIALFLVDANAIVVVAHKFGLGHHHITHLDAHANLPGVLDAKLQLEGHFKVIAVHLIALEAVHFVAVGAVLDELQRVGSIGVHDA